MSIPIISKLILASTLCITTACTHNTAAGVALAPLALADWALMMGTLGIVRPNLYEGTVNAIDGTKKGNTGIGEIGRPVVLEAVLQPEVAGALAGAAAQGAAAGQAARPAPAYRPDPLLTPAQNARQQSTEAKAAQLREETRALTARVDQQQRIADEEDRRQHRKERVQKTYTGAVNYCFSFLKGFLVGKTGPEADGLYIRNVCTTDIQVWWSVNGTGHLDNLVRPQDTPRAGSLTHQPDDSFACPKTFNGHPVFIRTDDHTCEVGISVQADS